MLTVLTHDEEATRAFAAALAEVLEPGDVVALDGELGAGKTTFVRGLAEGLGIDGAEVSSPTFVLCHEYESRGGGGPTLLHLDAYRLADVDDIEAFGGHEILDGSSRAVVVVEWAERIGAALPRDRIAVRLRHDGGDRRVIELDAPAALRDRLAPFARGPVVTRLRRRPAASGPGD